MLFLTFARQLPREERRQKEQGCLARLVFEKKPSEVPFMYSGGRGEPRVAGASSL